MAERPPSILEACIRRGGLRKGMRVATYICQWAMAARELTEPLNAESVAAWWREPERTHYRYLHEFRETFPGLDTPDALAAQLNVQTDDLVAAVAELGRIPFPEQTAA